MKHLLTTALAVSILAALPVAAETTLRMAYVNNPGEPVDLVLTHWKTLLEERSNGEIKVDLYPSSQLGSQKDVTEQALAGINIISMTDAGFLADFDADIGIMFGPYLAEDPAQLFRIYDSAWWQQKEAVLAEKGVHIVAPNFLYGVRHLLTTKPVSTPDDLKGLKIRTPNNTMQIKAFEAMGATPTPMPLGEVYTALSQGVIDGVENPLSVLHGQKFEEVAKDLSLIGYLTNTNMLFAGEGFWQTLSPEEQAMIEETAYEAGLYSQTLMTEKDAETLQIMKDAGVTVIEVDPAPFREKAMAVYGQFPEWSEGLYQTIQDQLK